MSASSVKNAATTLESYRRHCWLKYCHSAINAHHHRSGLIRQGTGQEDYNEEVENLSTVKNQFQLTAARLWCELLLLRLLLLKQDKGSNNQPLYYIIVILLEFYAIHSAIGSQQEESKNILTKFILLLGRIEFEINLVDEIFFS